MSTVIELQYPYSVDFKRGYLNTNKEPRRVVALVGYGGTKTSTSYARYLMACSVSRYLEPDEHVDHVDNNKMNDVIGNLQILSQEENNRKGRSRTFIPLVCPVCGRHFKREARNVNYKVKQGKKPTCSRSCGGKQSKM